MGRIDMDRIDSGIQRRIDTRARLFRIEIFSQFGRALDIRKQRGHVFALALTRFHS